MKEASSLWRLGYKFLKRTILGVVVLILTSIFAIQSGYTSHHGTAPSTREAQNLQNPSIHLRKYVRKKDNHTHARQPEPAWQAAQSRQTALTVLPGDHIEYKFVVENKGNTAFKNVRFTAQTPCLPQRIHPTVDENQLLKRGEQWIYQCTQKNIQENSYQASSVEAEPAYPNGDDISQNKASAEDIALVMLRQNKPALDLRLYVLETGSRLPGTLAAKNKPEFQLEYNGDLTWFMELSNTGNERLANVVIAGSLAPCINPFFVEGDDNKDQQLDLKEVWLYRCDYRHVRKDLTYGVAVQAIPVKSRKKNPFNNTIGDQEVSHIVVTKSRSHL